VLVLVQGLKRESETELVLASGQVLVTELGQLLVLLLASELGRGSGAELVFSSGLVLELELVFSPSSIASDSYIVRQPTDSPPQFKSTSLLAV
jgi:hypothetical protein